MIRTLLKAIAFPLLLPFTFIRWSVGAVRRPRLALLVDLEGLHSHRPQSSVFRSRDRGLSRRALRTVLRRAAKDARVEVVRVRVGPLAGGWATLFELRKMLADVRAAGKRVVAIVPQPTTRSLWLASVADEVLLPPDATVMATGIGAEMSFYGAAFEKAGLDVEVVNAGAFKSAMEPFTRTGPSEANAQAVNALLDDLYDRLVTEIGGSRGQSPEAIRAAFDHGPYLPETAVERGLADAIVAEEEVRERIGYDEDGPLKPVHASDYSGKPMPWPRFRWRRPQLAVVEVRGAIRDGRHDDPDPSGAVTKAVVAALGAARRDKRIKGVLLHVDSPGGSAVASEHMWRAVRRLAEKKPVVAWMGDVAASGGYYVPCAAHEIVAAPGTLTGSIGVIAAKPVLARVLDRFGINRVRFERGPQANMFSLSRGFSEAERVAIEASIQQTYQLFLRRVGEGRGRAPESVHPVAQGRVWTGAQALEHGLVDGLGDEWEAVARLAKRAELDVPETLRVIRAGGGLKQKLRRLVGLNSGVLRELTILQLARDERVLAWCPLEL